MFDCMCSKQSIGQKMGDKNYSRKNVRQKLFYKKVWQKMCDKNVQQTMFDKKCTPRNVRIQSNMFCQQTSNPIIMINYYD